MKIDKLEITSNSQDLYDNFNGFIMSNDERVFNKLIARTMLYHKIKNIPGDIVECGVFKGTGMYTFLKLKRIFNPNTSKQVIGFDFFDTDKLLSSITTVSDTDTMTTLFKDREFKHTNSFKDDFKSKLLNDGFKDYEFDLIDGDISDTTEQFSKNNPGFKISLLYMDVDLEVPTYNALKNLWGNMTKGGIVVFDEYGYHKWSESRGVDRFIEEYNIELHSLDSMCPTAYIVKK
jgi:hypothetical protein